MASLEQARTTQIKNIEAKTGKRLDALKREIGKSGLSKHGEIRGWIMDKYKLGYGDANTLAHVALESDGQTRAEAKGLSTADVESEIYAGPKAALRPIHDAIMKKVDAFGDFEKLPKKGYISLRRKKQFAMIGPATKDQIEIGLNAKNLSSKRLTVVPAGGMCQYKIRLSDTKQVDAELIGFIRSAFDAAG